jgi:uncharacterized integral membrane protein
MKSGSLRLGLVSAAALVVLVVILQNTEVVDVRFLWWEFRMSRVVLMVLTGAVGFLAGCAVAKLTGSRRKPAGSP